MTANILDYIFSDPPTRALDFRVVNFCYPLQPFIGQTFRLGTESLGPTGVIGDVYITDVVLYYRLDSDGKPTPIDAAGNPVPDSVRTGVWQCAIRSGTGTGEPVCSFTDSKGNYHRAPGLGFYLQGDGNAVLPSTCVTHADPAWMG